MIWTTPCSCGPDGLARRAADYFAGADPARELASPIFADLTELPPLLIQAGSHEILLDDATRLAARAAAGRRRRRAQGHTRRAPRVPGVRRMLDEADRALTRAGEFLHVHLTGSRS